MADISLETVGIVAGIGASLATVVALVVTLVDRRRKRDDAERVMTQNIYVTENASPQPAAASAAEGTSIASSQKADDDVRYVLLLEACMWLAADLYLAWPTLGEKRRSIDLIERFAPELQHDVAKYAPELDAARAGTARLIRSFLSTTFEKYVEVMRINTSWLENSNDGGQEPEDLERERKSLRYDFVMQREAIEERLRANRAYLSALAELKKSGPWEVLGFATPEDYTEYLQPTMRSLTSSPGELAEDVLSRLLDGPISLHALEEENLPFSIRVELMNRLLADQWAELTSDGIALTDPGKRLLKKRLAAWQSTTPSA